MKKGFTLSEVLVTLSVVGIVAVLTIPGVMRNYQNRMYTAQLEKIYAQVSSAAQTIMSDEHVDNFYETSGSRATTFAASDNQHQNPTGGIGSFLTRYFKTTRRNCQDGNACASTADSYYSRISGAGVKGLNTAGGNYYCVMTVSGATLCGGYTNTTRPCASIMVDVNGVGQPNVTGRDVFAMDIHPDGSVSDYGSGCVNGDAGDAPNTCSSDSDVMGSAGGCLNSIMAAGWVMEY